MRNIRIFARNSDVLPFPTKNVAKYRDVHQFSMNNIEFWMKTSISFIYRVFHSSIYSESNLSRQIWWISTKILLRSQPIHAFQVQMPAENRTIPSKFPWSISNEPIFVQYCDFPTNFRLNPLTPVSNYSISIKMSLHSSFSALIVVCLP